MLVSRRDFIHAGCTVAAASLVPKPALAWSHGSVTGNQNRVTINAIGSGQQPYANFAKSISWGIIDPTIVDANGYFVSPTTIAGPVNGSAGFDPNYYGHYIWKWTGTGTMWVPHNIIVYNTQLNGVNTSGVVQGVAGTSGWVSGAVVAAQNTPRIEFSLGVLINGAAAIHDSGVSNGAGGTYIDINVSTNSTGNIPTQPVSVQNSALNGNIVGQTNAIGTWNWTAVNASTIRLTTNTVTGAASAYNAGNGTGTGGEVVSAGGGLSIKLGNAAGGTFTNFNNLVFCKLANETAVNNGQINDPDYVTTLKNLFNYGGGISNANRGWLRFLDLDGERGYQCDSALRIPVGALSYNNYNGSYFTPSTATGTYWGGNITTSDGKAFTVANPTGRGTGAYTDNEIVQGIFNLTSPTTNTSGLPTLALGTRGAKPIFTEANVANPHISFAAAPTAINQTVILSLQASWLNSGVAVSYTYTSISGDVNNLTSFYNNLAADMTANASIGTSATKINFFISADLQILSRHANAGPLTVTYTGGTGPVPTLYTVSASSFTNGDYTTFVYSTNLGGWIWQGQGTTANGGGGMVMSVPWEQIIELCNQVGAHCWINWPLFTKGQYITDQTNFFGDVTTGLTSGLRFGTETANEIWLAQAAGPYDQSLWIGSSLAFPYPSSGCVWGVGGLRCLQYRELSMPAWTGKGRAASDHYIILESQIGNSNTAIGSSFDTNALQSALLNTSTNTIYATYGGLGGTAATDYHTSPNRLCDKITATGHATYWYSDYICQTASGINGTVTANASWLQASVDYANGNTASAFSALTNLFSTAGTGVTHQTGDWASFLNFFQHMEAMVAQYDNSAGRTTNGVNPKISIMHYEAGPQWSFNTNLTNGTNSTSDSTSLTALANQMSNLGWNVAAYGSSSTDYSGVAQKVINMTQGWKNDTDHTGAAANTGSYKTMIKTSYYQALVGVSNGTGREVKPGQYGFEDNTWGLYPVDYRYANPYTNYNAIQEWNAGS